MRNSIFSKTVNKYFGKNLDIRVQAFNLLGCAGITIGLVSAIAEILTDRYISHILINLFASAFGIFVLWLAKHTGKYRFFYLLTVIAART